MEQNQHANAQTDLIYGSWYLESPTLDGSWLLQREHVVPGPGSEVETCGYGQWFEFHENGEMVDYYSAPCGNDEWLHRWTGTWKLGEGGRTLIMQIENYSVRGSCGRLKPSEAYKKGQEFCIIEITK